MTNDERAMCHGRPRSSDGHEPSDSVPTLNASCKFCRRSVTNVLGVWMLSAGEPQLPPKPEGNFVFLDAAGQVTNCDRCGDPCRVADRRNPASRPFRLSEKPKGVCANCVMTQFLYNTYPVNWQIDEAGPELLLKPGIREAFLASGMLDKCDLNISEVNWNKVVANWSLPVAIVKSGKNPYRMGDSSKSYLNQKRGQPEPEEDAFTKKWRPILAETSSLSGELGREFMEESGLRALLDQAKGTVQ